MNLIKISFFTAFFAFSATSAFAQAGGQGGGGAGGDAAGASPMRVGGPIIDHPRPRPKNKADKSPDVCGGHWVEEPIPNSRRTRKQCRLIYFY